MTSSRTQLLGARGHPGRIMTALRRRMAGAKKPRPCPRARGLKVGQGCLVLAPFGPCAEESRAAFFSRSRHLGRCRRVLNSTAEFGAAKRPGAGLSLRPYFLARRPLLHRGLLRVELAATEARRCAPAPLTGPCTHAMTPATPCTDAAPPAALNRRLTPPSPHALSTPFPARLRRRSRDAV